jgi:hydrogenase nickel incorporation protein HypA/HybF
MHELTQTQNLLDLVLKNSNSKRIVKVRLLIGPFSDEREESIRFYWRDLSKGTASEGAVLHFDHIQADMTCLACGGTFSLEDNESICEFCQRRRSHLLNEDEVMLESIDVE